MLIQITDKSELVLLKLSLKEAEDLLKWEHSREFEFRGVMYDVVETATKQDSVYYWCWEDSEETALNSKLDKLVQDNAGLNKKNIEHTKQLSNYLSLLFYEDNNEYGNLRTLTSERLSSSCLQNYNFMLSGPEPPPPRYC